MFKRVLLAVSLAFYSISGFCNDKTVSLATLEWPPYIGTEMRDNGYVYQVVKRAFEKAGYEVSINYYPWARALSMASSGNVDALFPEYYDESRLDEFDFSAPFPGGPVGFYKRRKDDIKFSVDPREHPHEALQSLTKFSFGIVRGYINTKAFDEAAYLLKDSVSDDELNLKKLFAKRIDLIFIDKYVASYLITEKYPWMADSLEFMEPALEEKRLYLAFSKKAEASARKRADFDKALEEMSASGELQNIILDHGF